MTSVTEIVNVAVEARYQLRSISPAPTPDGSLGHWYRYVIVQGDNEITGLRSGSESEVDYAVREMIDRLNERSAGKNAKKAKPTQIVINSKPLAKAG